FSIQFYQLTNSENISFELSGNHENIAIDKFLNVRTLDIDYRLREKELQLLQNYPNPFNGSTTIPFIVNKSGMATVKVTNTMGSIIYNGTINCETGYNEHEINLHNQSGGVLIYQVHFNETIINSKMILR
ncbi:MAG: T9SS type A sorting domain-containing protein, partial [Cyclobacteriaceae bacterium]